MPPGTAKYAATLRYPFRTVPNCSLQVSNLGGLVATAFEKAFSSQFVG